MINLRKLPVAVMICGFCLGLSSISVPALAEQRAECSAPQSGGSMSESTYAVLERAVEDLSNDRFREAERRLTDILDRVKDYELAIVHQTLGFVFVQQDNYTDALVSFEKALELEALPRQPHEELMLNAGQIYMANNNFEQGIAMLERYLEQTCSEPAPEVHLTLASAYAETQEYESALVQVNLALSKAKQPREQWLQLKLALHFELGQMAECAETLFQLIALVPDREEYWRQLSGVLMQVEKEADALAVMAVAERQGYLQNERDLMNLANIYLMLEIPYKAARLVARGLEDEIIDGTSDNFEYLSEAWIAAREWDYAETILRSAAQSSESGELWQRLAQVLMEKEDWLGAQNALSSALSAGVPEPGHTSYLLGVAAYYAGNVQEAKQALREAINYPDSEQQARQWLDHLRHQEAVSANLD